MRVTIDQINTKSGTSSKGPWQRWGVRVGEVWYNTLKPEIGKVLVEGGTYDFEIEQQGQYQNITKAVKVLGPAPSPSRQEPDLLDAELAGKPPTSAKPKPLSAAGPIAPTQNGDKDRQIARAVALKAAVEHPEVPVATIIARAEELEKWLLR